MDEDEFERVLELFPVVRPRDYHVDLDSSKQSTSRSTQSELSKWHDARDDWDKRNRGTDLHDAFWEKLKLAAERKVGAAGAEKFCRAFQQIHQKLVYDELSLDAARSFLNSSKS